MSTGVDFDCDFCESSHWFGREGVCDFESLVCICPEGFSGKDDWLTFSGCQVNDNLRRILHIVLFCLCPIGAVACILSFFLLAKKWKFRILTTQQPQPTLFSPPSSDARSQSRSLKEISVKNWKRKQYMLITMFFFMIHFIGGILYNFPLLSGENREENPRMVATGLTMAVVGARPAIALIILVWYYSLPDVSRYGTLLRLNDLLVRYPNFIPKALFWEIIILTPILIVLMMVLPLSNLAGDLQVVADLTTNIILLLATAFDLILFLFTIQNVEHVFGMAVETFGGKDGQTTAGNERKYEISDMKLAIISIKRAKTTVIMIHLLILGFLLFAMVRGGTENFFFLSICFALLCMCLIPGPVAFVLLDDHLTPKLLKKNDLTTSDT